jgi:hypothetical protein
VDWQHRLNQTCAQSVFQKILSAGGEKRSVSNPFNPRSENPIAEGEKIRVQSVQSVFQNPIAAGEKIRA